MGRILGQKMGRILGRIIVARVVNKLLDFDPRLKSAGIFCCPFDKI